MELNILLSNLTNPTLLFFILGMVAFMIKSDLEIPKEISKFISLYLLFSIGFKGGMELSHSKFDSEIIMSVLLGLCIALIVPLYTFFILKRKLSISDAGAIAAAYGSVSAVTFVSATNFLELQHKSFDGHMVAVMALMEAPAIIVGVVLMRHFDKNDGHDGSLKEIVMHSFTNGSVLLILGSLIIGFVADGKQAEGIKPFTTDIFKGFLALFLLEMGMITAKRFGSFKKYGFFVAVFAILIPVLNGCFISMVSGLFLHNIGNRFILAILAASASYIAVPAAMKLAAPKADPGLYIPMALGVTFPINITVGFPLYYLLTLQTAL